MDRLLGLISLAQKAGRAKNGAEQAMAFARAGKVRLLILAVDASENTRRAVLNLSHYYKIDLIERYTKGELASISRRDETAVIGIADAGFAKRIKELNAAMPKEGVSG